MFLVVLEPAEEAWVVRCAMYSALAASPAQNLHLRGQNTRLFWVPTRGYRRGIFSGC
jgi:hypothetical protein